MEQPKTHLAFPPVPKNSQPLREWPTATVEQKKCLEMKQKGILSLAVHIYQTDELRKQGKGPFVVENALTLITDTLLSVVEGWLEMIMMNKLHRVHTPPRDAYRQNPSGGAIYGLVLCGEKGVPPNSREVGQALTMMEKYIHDFGDDNSNHEYDQLAATIDGTSPDEGGRNWRQGNDAYATKQWKNIPNTGKLFSLYFFLSSKLEVRRIPERIPESQVHQITNSK